MSSERVEPLPPSSAALPAMADAAVPRRLQRALPSSPPSPPSSAFVVTAKTFAKQFAALYFLRLHALRPHCTDTARHHLAHHHLTPHTTQHQHTTAPHTSTTPTLSPHPPLAHRQAHAHPTALQRREEEKERGRAEDAGGEETVGSGDGGGSDAVLLCGRLLDVAAHRRCVLVGTLYKEQKLKPSILAEYSQQKKGHAPPTLQATSTQRQREEEGEAGADEGEGAGEVQPQPSGWVDAQLAQQGRWVSDDDAFILEDETGRIHLIAHHTAATTSADVMDVLSISPSSSSPPSASIGSFDGRRLCTGVVVGVLGVLEDGGGRFRVEQIFLPGMAPQTPRPPLLSASSSPPPLSPSTPRYALLVSGLSFGCPTVDPLPAQLLQDFCTGYIGQPAVAHPALHCTALHQQQRRRQQRPPLTLGYVLSPPPLPPPLQDLSLASSISCVIIAGNSLHRFSKKRSKDGLKEVAPLRCESHCHPHHLSLHR